MKTKSIAFTAFLAIAAIFSIATIASTPAAFAAVTSCRDHCGNPISHGSAPQPNSVGAQPDFNMGTQSSSSGGNAQNPTPVGSTPQPHSLLDLFGQGPANSRGQASCNDDCGRRYEIGKPAPFFYTAKR